MRKLSTTLGALSLVAMMAFDQGKTVAQSTVREIDSPAGPSSGEPNLFTAPDGRVFLSWIEAVANGRHSLRFSIRDGQRWSEPRTISEGSDWSVNWANFPSLIVAADGSLVAHWLVKAGSDSHASYINIARSTDQGKTWGKPFMPHRDNTTTEHGFVSMLPLGRAEVGALWLDGRQFGKASKANEHSAHPPSSNEMTLRWAVIGKNGELAEEALLDARVCDCCQTSAALTSEGPVVVYRDRSPEEVRDISIIRLVKGRWTEPRTVHADGWHIQGCPVNGPSIAADGRRVAVSWFTAARDSQRVNIAFSTDAGASFAQPVKVDEGSPVGRVDVRMLGDGSALVCWLERTSKGGEIKARRVRADGSRDQSRGIAVADVARATGFPRMTRAGDDVIFAWTDSSSPSRVRVSTLSLRGN
ncbi:MAG TPA: sialidase family protein [Blastocatellia bacterium]|nr:sialidase family protein [Blastocatellia bacterium]